MSRRSWQPILGWRHLQTRDTLRADLVAGLTGALIVLPQGVAFATIAGLPPEVGLYAAMVPTVVAALFGSSWHLVTGPTTAISLVVLASVAPLAEPGTERYVGLVLTLTLMTGVFQLALGLARAGALVNFISHTVVIGFTAGAAVLIATSQVGSFLGLDLPRGLEVHEVVAAVATGLGEVNPYAALVAVTTLVTGAALRRPLPRTYLIVALVVGSLTALLADAVAGGSEVTGIETVGALDAGLPPLSLPVLSPGVVGELFFPALLVTLLALTEAVSISRALAVRSGQLVDGNREFVGQGLANVAGSFFSGYAASGSFNRSAVNYHAGARTPVAAISSAAFLVVIVMGVASLAEHLPTAAMAGLLLLVAYGIVDLTHIRSIVRTSRPETAVLAVTLVGTLLDLERGIFLGIILSLVLYLYRTSRPTMVPVVPDPDPEGYYYVPAEGRLECPQLKMVRVQGSIFFGAVNHVEQELRRIDEEDPRARHVLVVATTINFVDVAGAEMLVAESRRRRELGGDLYFYRLQESVRSLLVRGDYLTHIDEENIFPTKSHPVDAVYPRLDPEVCRTCTARIFSQCDVVLPDGSPR